MMTLIVLLIYLYKLYNKSVDQNLSNIKKCDVICLFIQIAAVGSE